jgi:hypothetical protein
MTDKQPTDADVTEAQAILKFNAKIRKTGTTEEVKMINPADEMMAKDVLDRAEKFGVKPIVVPKKNKGGPVNKPKMMHGGMHKKAEMMGGGMYKGKKHSYAGGGMVKDMKLMRSK